MATSVANVLNRRKNVQSTIFNAGKELHHRYKAGSKLNFTQMKTMKCGLSNILNLSEEDMQYSQRSLFSPDTWNKLIRKYNCFNLSLPASIESFNDKWETISDLCIINKDSLLGKKYISTLESSPAITIYQLRILDLFREVIYLVDSRRFMLNQENRAKISERDFTYQLWLPIFQKIFHINDEIIRIKVGETVLSESTESKASIYTSSSNIVGFKVDIRFLLDFETEEFDLACAEACIPVVPVAKIHHDMSKLLREGKIMQTAALNVIQNSSIYSWVIQISGPSCSFYTVHGTKNQYHVCVHQFMVVFPKEYSELPSFLKSLSNILMFRDSLEATANSMKAAILKTRSDMDEGDLGASRPSTPTVFESASIYHTPPHRDSSNSRMPEGIYFDEFTESELGSSPGSTSHVHDTETDALGFVQNGEKWTNVLTGKTYSYNPYEL
ncbi:uncharacterized protein BX663DRAFT_519662 [Cokeromyces recurvatus]|uniref:uncharacterized protein n=1 Tax=Cokeromyces recurvatus TaxID=90255 RepID=UPI00221FDEB9|nr:uncharacterized protein BX663DRAFT_519662 [Cokeromyces recurvatus]KAI7899835.1 hypothetical protein BX663DRAFT_519662 [Cokeromyces recurvatus]